MARLAGLYRSDLSTCISLSEACEQQNLQSLPRYSLLVAIWYWQSLTNESS